MKKSIRFLLILVVGSAILFLLDKTQVFSSGVGVTQRSIVSPLSKAANQLISGVVAITEPATQLREFANEYEGIKRERDHYRGEYFRLLGVEEENNLLKGSLELTSSTQEQLVLASVLSYDPLRPTQALTLDKGKKDGVEVGDAVVIAGRILIGRINTVLPDTSGVLLITSEASRVVTRLERSNTNAIITGSTSGVLVLDLVLPDTELVEGEIITSSGLEGDIPPNLLVGQVRSVTSEETASFKKATVEPFFSTSDLRHVFIVK